MTVFYPGGERMFRRQSIIHRNYRAREALAPGDELQSIEGALAPPSSSSERLPLSVILMYCLPTVGCGFMFLLVGLYLMKFATDVLLIAPAAMGTIFGLSRIWDAISDPVAGYLSWSPSSCRRSPVPGSG